MSQIFISYSREDKNYAFRLVDSLEMRGFTVWFDERINYGSQWPRVIRENIDKSTAFIVVMTPRSENSDMVQNELTWAMRNRLPVFPLMLEGDVWLNLVNTQYVDVSGGVLPPERFYGQLAQVVPRTLTNIFSSTPPEEKYKATASVSAPALVLVLLDASASMSQNAFDGRPKIKHSIELVQKIAVWMVQRSAREQYIYSRFRVGMFAYSSRVTDLLSGILTIEELGKTGLPNLSTQGLPDWAAAFSEAEHLLLSDLPNYQDSPAPRILHITNGENTGGDPLPIAKRIMQLGTKDGEVLIANMTFDETISSLDSEAVFPYLERPESLYGQTLFDMSSPIPESYRLFMGEFGLNISKHRRLLCSASSSGLFEAVARMSD